LEQEKEKHASAEAEIEEVKKKIKNIILRAHVMIKNRPRDIL